MLRLGKITYTNILPVYHYFDHQAFAGEVQLIPQIPSQLNKQMKEGRIDVGPISSFSYAENHMLYYALPDLSISCKGAVKSIFLFSKKPIEELDGAKIALTSSSASSAVLLQIILRLFYGHYCHYATHEPNLYIMLEAYDAALLIGDDALTAKKGDRYLYRYDLGEEWYRFTQKSITFALWAVRKEATAAYPALLSRLHQHLLLSKQKGAQSTSDLSRMLENHFMCSASYWEDYFNSIIYDFSEQHLEGLHYFFKLAAELGLLKEPIKVQMWEPRDVLSR
jgi:chorismate dehydratase